MAAAVAAGAAVVAEEGTEIMGIKSAAGLEELKAPPKAMKTAKGVGRMNEPTL